MRRAESNHRIRVVLVGGHESAEGVELRRIADRIDDAISAGAGRGFHNAVSVALEQGDTVVVVPMTFGRNPTMVADAAKTLKWLKDKHEGRVALTAPFGQPDHLIAWLRRAANGAKAVDAGTALLIVAPPSNPFDEAELHRIAYLVGTNGALGEVGVAIAADEAKVAASVERLHRLGSSRVAVVPAGFAASVPAADADHVGPLMSDAAIIRVVRTRVGDALASLEAGDDGIDDGLMADHGHGYAHSHAFEEAQGGHAHPHGHSHSHQHTHSHAHTHSHSDEHQHAHSDEHQHSDEHPHSHGHSHHHAEDAAGHSAGLHEHN
jgi:hypothetical protein